MHDVYLAPKVFLAFAMYFHFGNDFVDRYIASVGKRTRGMEPVKQNLSNIFLFHFFLSIGGTLYPFVFHTSSHVQ